jgi:hypothetical protein
MHCFILSQSGESCRKHGYLKRKDEKTAVAPPCLKHAYKQSGSKADSTLPCWKQPYKQSGSTDLNGGSPCFDGENCDRCYFVTSALDCI